MTVSTLTNGLIVIAVIGYLIVKRMSWNRFDNADRDTWIGPAIMVGIGLYQMRGTLGGDHLLTGTDLALLGTGLVVSLGTGAFLGRVVELRSTDSGHFFRYGGRAMAFWGLFTVLRAGLAVLGHVLGAAVTAGGGSLMVSLGVNLLGQASMINSRLRAGASDDGGRFGHAGAGTSTGRREGTYR